MHHIVTVTLAVLGTALLPYRLGATELPADVSVFGEQPATFRDGVTPFPPSGSTWQFQQDGNDPITRLKFLAVPGMKNGLGRFTWRLASLGKYIVMGNGQTSSVGGEATDLRVGIFNSETKQYCDLIIDPTLAAAPAQIVTGNPGARQSRILLALGTHPGVGGAAAFGYVFANLDAADPCTWLTVMVSAVQLNAGLPAADHICPNDLCSFDTLARLGHEDVAGDPYGRDYVAVGDYLSGRIAVIRVDAGGIAVVDTYQTTAFGVAGSGGACYKGGAARPPASDVRQPDTRPANDWRFVFSFDAFLQQIYSTPPPASCAPAYPYCPRDIAGGAPGAGCPPGGSCTQAYCAKPFFGSYLACTTSADCQPFGSDIGPCQTSCLQKSSLFRCRTSTGGGSHRQCLQGQPDTCPTAGETCTPGSVLPDNIGPSQEYRFDKTTNTITPTSGRFFSMNPTAIGTGPTPTGTLYASDRSVWLQVSGTTGDVGLYKTHASTDNCTVNGTTVYVPAGEHCYYDPTNPTTAVVVPPDQILAFERTPMIPYQLKTLEVNGAMYFADTGSLQYAQNYLGGWFPVDDTVYKTAFAYGPPYVPLTDPLMASALPAEPLRCSGSLRGCNVTADCPAGQTCVATAEDGVPLLGQHKFLEAGGAPKSMWVSSGYAQAVPVAQTDVYLERVPIALSLPDNLSAVRPSIAWGSDRLWLVAENGGQLKYRIRDDGVWSGWHSLAPHNITPVGGPAVIAGTTTRIYARDAAGNVYEKRLTSATSCAPGTCLWTSWTALPTAVKTNDDIAATYFSSVPFVAVRGTDDGLYVTGLGFGWVPWFRVGATMTTNAAPSLTYHTDGHLWIAARQKGTGAQMYSRINVSTFAADPWAGLPAAPVATWGTGPAVVSDGTRVRLFALDSAYPQYAWQIANDGSGWSGWRRPLGGSSGTRQPAVTTINGEIGLLTYWLGMHEAMLP